MEIGAAGKQRIRIQIPGPDISSLYKAESNVSRTGKIPYSAAVSPDYAVFKMHLRTRIRNRTGRGKVTCIAGKSAIGYNGGR